MKNLFKTILAVALAAFTFASCEDYQAELLSENTVSISSDKLSFEANPTAPKTVTVNIEGDWIATVPTECDWLKVSPSYGTGTTEVTITASKNTDGTGAMAGPRSSMVNFTSGGGTTVLAVSQMGDITKLSAKTYTKVTDVTPGASYLLIAKNGEEYYAGTPVPTSSVYAYLLKKDVTANVQADGSIVMPDGSYGFTFEATAEEGQYIIRQADGEALWQSASYQNFYTDVEPTEGYIWTVEPQEDGTVIIKSVDLGKWLQYSITYSSYGGYTSTQDNALLPFLYENADKVLGVTPTSVTLTDGDLEEEFTIVCDADLVDAIIDEDCDWISLVSNNSDGQKSTLTFKSSKNPNLTSRSASILIGSVDATVKVGVSQPARALTPEDIVEVTVAEFNEAEVGETMYRITAAISSVVKASKGSFNIKDYSGETLVYGFSDFAATGAKEGDVVTIVGKRDQYNTTIEMTSAYFENVNSVEEVSIAEFLAKEVSTEAWYKVTGTITSIANETYGNMYISDGTDELYIYGVYGGYGATGDYKKGLIAEKGIEAGDKITVIGNRGYFEKNDLDQMVNGFYVSHEKKQEEGGDEGDESNVFTITENDIPTAYPSAEETKTINGVDFAFYNVAHYSNAGIQFKKSVSAYVKTVTGFEKNIKTIKVTVLEGKSWFPDNLELTADSVVITPTKDATSSTYDLSGGEYKNFTLTNTSTYTVNLGSIEITFAE
ncbi:MAG: BACON domain-containing protein [Candidatus Cryptobacteroides sp.]